jgi:anaerobic glycerol-3-phosphate dehydrogenase
MLDKADKNAVIEEIMELSVNALSKRTKRSEFNFYLQKVFSNDGQSLCAMIQNSTLIKCFENLTCDEK